MLVSFKVKNFRSIYEVQELTLLATKYASLQNALLRDKRVPSGILPLIVIYGANAAGKTNMLRALSFVGDAVNRSHNRWKPDAKLPIESHFFHKSEPTDFECQFLLQRDVFRFGFSLDENRILKEFLYRGKTLIYRRTANRYRVGPELGDVNNIKRNTRTNSLFVSTAAQNNHPLLKKVHAWFASWDSVTHNRTFEEALSGHLLGFEEARSFIASLAHVLNPNIVDIEPAQSVQNDLSQPSEAEEAMNVMMQDHAKWVGMNLVHKSDDRSKTAKLQLWQESKGTQSYLALAHSISSALEAGSILLLDEADQSLHPTLLRSIVMLFQSPETNPRKAQLIFNTHDTTLLAPEVLRPDQVWFMEQSLNSSSKAYCLADFEGVRSETKAQRAYLEGRFGALPFLEAQAQLFIEQIHGRTGRTQGA